MKLLYIYDKMPNTYQAYLIHLLEELKKKINVKVLSYDNDKIADYNIISNTKLNRLVSRIKVFNRPSLDVKIMSEYDIIHLQHSYLFYNLPPYFYENNKKPKLVITLRGADTYVKPWVYKWWKELYSKQSKYIDAFVTVSEHQKEYLQKWGVEKEKIHVIPVSFGTKAKAMPKYPSSNTIKVVSAHRMCWEKNIEGNLRVIKILKEKGKSVKYDIYGDGPDAGQVHYLIDKYSLEKEVSYIGKVENSIFKKKLPNYDFFLQLSHSESFGASVIEAQSVGVPAIISNSGGLPETIVDCQSGYCVDSWDTETAADNILKLQSDKELYLQFSESAIKNSNLNFSTNTEVDKLIELYKNII